MSFKRVQLKMKPDLVARLDAQAKLENRSRTELIELACEMMLSQQGAVEGTDATMKMLRKLIQDEVTPQFNRMAKMISKTTKASATAMYMQVVELNHAGQDAVSIFRDSEARAANYLTSKE
ncbi:CopG family transcriptional regulator [Paenibacillus pasadenensis]|uniref:ribbon-helix-helix domain-containing protein n=1 Tax=Paenibacillus pasadenensis TaxID=217090 RepID=UPI000C79D3EB|nr:CopG family transcriptional regulator [Paenibacillus pasadenensis]